MRIHDVTVVNRAGMPTWPGEGGPRSEPITRLARGDTSNVSLLTFGDHTGTHVDPPLHFIDGAKGADELPLDVLVGSARVVAYDGDDHIAGSWLEQAGIPRGTTRVLFKAKGNAGLWSRERFVEDYVALDGSGAEWCVARGIRLVGIDYLSIEPFGSDRIGHPVHHTLLGAGVVVIEGLDLTSVAPGEYELFCGALKFEKGTGAPARVLLVER